MEFSSFFLFCFGNLGTTNRAVLMFLQGAVICAAGGSGNSPNIGRGHDGWLPSVGTFLSIDLIFLLLSCSEGIACSKLGGGCTSYLFLRILDTWVQLFLVDGF